MTDWHPFFSHLLHPQPTASCRTTYQQAADNCPLDNVRLKKPRKHHFAQQPYTLLSVWTQLWNDISAFWKWRACREQDARDTYFFQIFSLHSLKINVLSIIVGKGSTRCCTGRLLTTYLKHPNMLFFLVCTRWIGAIQHIWFQSLSKPKQHVLVWKEWLGM